MRNALRLLVLVLALAVVGSTAALSQLWVHQRAKARAAVAEGPAPAVIADRPADFAAYRADQRRAFALLLGTAFAALVVVALTPAAPRDPDGSAPVREDRGSLEHLARANVAQGAALARERDERQRAESEAHARQLQLNQALEAKLRLGRDLHDGLIQTLYATGLTLEAARTSIPNDPTETSRRLETGVGMINSAIREVRTYITGLARTPENPVSLAGSFHALTRELCAGREVRFEVRVDENAAARLSPPESAEVVQIAREAVSNALRHGGATEVTLRLHEGDGAVCLLVQDNGRGFPPAPSIDAPATGQGLANMRARAGGLGGSIRFSTAPSGGARVVLTLPVPPAGASSP